jgi:hypothetical protein
METLADIWRCSEAEALGRLLDTHGQQAVYASKQPVDSEAVMLDLELQGLEAQVRELQEAVTDLKASQTRDYSYLPPNRSGGDEE